MSSHHHHPQAAMPAFSLLRLSALERFAGVLVLIAAIWAGVFWAWN